MRCTNRLLPPLLHVHWSRSLFCRESTSRAKLLAEMEAAPRKGEGTGMGKERKNKGKTGEL